MTVQLRNDHREFIWLSTDTKPTIAPFNRGATGFSKDTGEQWIYDGTDWVEDPRLIYALEQVLG